MLAWWAAWHICRLYFHFWVAVCFFFRTSACAKRFTWKWLDFHESERTGDIHFHTKTRFATEAKINLELAYLSMSWLREPLIKCCDMLRWNVAIVSWPWSGLYTINSYSIFQYNPDAVSLAQVTCKDCIWEMNDKWNPLMEEQTLSSYDQASCEGQSCRDVAHSRRVKIDTKT